MRPLAARRLGRFGRPRRRLRAGLVQLLCALAGLGLGLLLPRITLDSTVASTRVTETLVAVGFGVLGLVTIIFSLLFLVVQWAFTSLSPRLNLFRDDPIVWRTFALAIGVFVFSVTTALVIGDQQKVSVIVPAAEMAAVLAAIALIRTLQVKAFASIQLAPTLAAIAGQGRGILDDLYSRPYTAEPEPGVWLPPRRRAVPWPHRQAILQQIDLGRLLRAADGAVIVLRIGMGDTLQQGAPVADLHGGEVTDKTVLAGLVTGPERTFHQDPLFAFRLLADIALRALSPAVNDPAAAVQVLETIESLLQLLVSRDLDVAEVADDAGTVRVVLALPSWDDYLRTALDDLLESAAQSPMVLLRARALLTTLLNAAPPARQPPITRRLQRAEQLGDGNFAVIWHDATGTACPPGPAGGHGLHAGELGHEPAEEVPVGLRPADLGTRCVAGDFVGDVGHGLVEVLAGPGLVVGQRGGERWRGGRIGHCISFPPRAVVSDLVSGGSADPGRDDRHGPGAGPAAAGQARYLASRSKRRSHAWCLRLASRRNGEADIPLSSARLTSAAGRRSGRITSSHKITRVSSESFHAECSYPSSKNIVVPSAQCRVWPLTVIPQESGGPGIFRARWQRTTPRKGPRCGGMCLPGARIEKNAVTSPGTWPISTAVAGQRARLGSDR